MLTYQGKRLGIIDVIKEVNKPRHKHNKRSRRSDKLQAQAQQTQKKKWTNPKQRYSKYS